MSTFATCMVLLSLTTTSHIISDFISELYYASQQFEMR
jgi:hypothetical protein